MELSQEDRERGTKMLVDQLEEMVESDPEISDIHIAFEHWCLRNYSIGNPEDSIRCGEKFDLGIDFYSKLDNWIRIGQAKIPERDYLEAHPTKVKSFGPLAVNDVANALDYLTNSETKLRANEMVKRLFAQVESIRDREDFRLEVFLVVFGKLNDRALVSFDEVRRKYESNKRIVIQKYEIDDLVSSLLLGARRQDAKIDFPLHYEKKQILSARDYCYFLANAGDIYDAFNTFGWRLFELNVRYELRNSSVNADIIKSLTHLKTRKYFHHFNNGLIIVCNNYQIPQQDNVVKLSGAQIVNGLQTVKSLYNAVQNKEVKLDDLRDSCLVQVKVIQNVDAKIMDQIVQATNNQNPMAPRNLRANSEVQKRLRAGFASLKPRWFLQVKEGEWDSLNQEGGRFFKDIAGFAPSEFRVDPAKKRGRVVDNQALAKAWLALIGFADLAGERTIHYFGDANVYDKAFNSSPADEHWSGFAQTTDFSSLREQHLRPNHQASANQYLLAYFLLELVQRFIPKPAFYRKDALDEGVRDGKLRKADGVITSSERDQSEYLASSATYQTWRVMANMKESLVEALSFLLAKRYGALSEKVCLQLLATQGAQQFVLTNDVTPIIDRARSNDELGREELFARSLHLLLFVSKQFWEEKQQTLHATSRLRTILLSAESRKEFKKQLLSANDRRNLSRPWKPEGQTFVDSLPSLIES